MYIPELSVPAHTYIPSNISAARRAATLNTSKKIFSWSGPNKEKVRSLKADILKGLIKNEVLSKNPVVASLCGALAKFERLLVERKITKAENIIGIQSPRVQIGHHGSEVVERLKHNLRELNFPMQLFVGEWEDFTTLSGINKVDVFDLDLCGAITKKRLLKAREFIGEYEPDVFFVTHSAARDVPSVQKLYREAKDNSIFLSLFKTEVDIKTLRLFSIPLLYDDYLSGSWYRYIPVKVVYYYDRAAGGQAMLQYVFVRLDSHDIQNTYSCKNKIVENLRTLKEEFEQSKNERTFDGSIFVKYT